MAKEIIIGRNPVLEYLKVKDGSNSSANLFVSDSAHGKIIDTIVNNAKQKGVKINHKPKEYFKNIGSSSKHQGVLLEVITDKATQKMDESTLLQKAFDNNGVLVLLDQLTDPHNVGSIIRSSEALGADGLILVKGNSSSITETVRKTAAGATAHLDIVTTSNVATFIDKAKKAGLWVIGTTDHGDKKLEEISSLKPALLIIGSEGKGMRRLTEEKCDYTVQIPLKGNISSLNASVAAGIVIYSLLN